MNFLNLAYSTILDTPLVCFIFGILISLYKPELRLPKTINKILTIYILFCIGLKGGASFTQETELSPLYLIVVLSGLVIWGLFQPLLSFFMLRSFTKIDNMTAAAVSASFGSVSVMTLVSAISFLEQMDVAYQQLILIALAIMEFPAIISGIFLANSFNKPGVKKNLRMMKILFDSVFNLPILSIISGMAFGLATEIPIFSEVNNQLLSSFKIFLCFFLFDLGLCVGGNKEHFRSFSWSLNFFGAYMPLIGAAYGLCLSYFLGLDAGTGTLIAVLTASASYIAVPAAMRIALPEAKEAIYLPLSLGIAFPFNVIIGIPLYYYIATKFLS